MKKQLLILFVLSHVICNAQKHTWDHQNINSDKNGMTTVVEFSVIHKLCLSGSWDDKKACSNEKLANLISRGNIFTFNIGAGVNKVSANCVLYFDVNGEVQDLKLETQNIDLKNSFKLSKDWKNKLHEYYLIKNDGTLMSGNFKIPIFVYN